MNTPMLINILAKLTISPPDADGLVWITADMGTRKGAVCVPERSVAGQAFLDWGAQAETALAEGKLDKPETAHG